MTLSKQNLIWIDLEMTGLNPERDRIIEIATIATDSQLAVLEEGPVFAIRQEESALRGMDEWNTRQHTQSGLLRRVRESACDLAAAEAATLDFARRYAPDNTSPMCGNSICQDRRFLYRWMPALERFFHYRNLDVSTVKELVQRWNGGKEQFSKDSSHLALQDIRDSIEELRFYRQQFFTC